MHSLLHDGLDKEARLLLLAVGIISPLLLPERERKKEREMLSSVLQWPWKEEWLS